jgi:hypothetical protein
MEGNRYFNNSPGDDLLRQMRDSSMAGRPENLTITGGDPVSDIPERTKKMKTKSEDQKALAPRAQSNTNVCEVKSEFTFLWTEADEWKPAKEEHEIMEDFKLSLPGFGKSR